MQIQHSNRTNTKQQQTNKQTHKFTIHIYLLCKQHIQTHKKQAYAQHTTQ